jgi:hypothetical protein
MIRPFSLPDLKSILQIENQSFPKSPYDWRTFLNLHYLYAETFWIYINPSTSPLEVSARVHLDPRLRDSGLTLSSAFLPRLKGAVGVPSDGSIQTMDEKKGRFWDISSSLRTGILSQPPSTLTIEEKASGGNSSRRR